MTPIGLRGPTDGSAPSPRDLLGSSPSMRELAELITVLARGEDATVLVLGERGTGKGRVAALIHRLSARSDGPFVEAVCGGSAAARESELGAGSAREPGLLARAAGGTLFLDDIAALDAAGQSELLRALDGGEAARGSGRAGARVVAATHRDLVAEVNAEHFREDLYYRLSAVPVYLPPLRARPHEDVAAVARAVLAELCVEMPGSPCELSREALDALVRYSWPGNLRELRNALERALIAAGEAAIVEPRHLSAEVRETSGSAPERHVPRTLAEVERQHVERTLRAHDGNRTHAAKELGISRATLIKKAKQYGV